MRSALLWLLLLLFGFLLIVVGIQGSLGRVIAVVFTPASLDVTGG